MIVFHRRIPQIFSNNVRTLFCDTAKSSPAGRHTRIWNKHGNKYELFRPSENVRVMFISNPKYLINNYNKEVIRCAIRVGAGFEDDPDESQGLAHLLEHVLTTSFSRVHSDTSLRCYTYDFETVYAFQSPVDSFVDKFGEWSHYLFSTSTLRVMRAKDIDEIVTLEKDRVDNEFHEKKNDLNTEKTVEILKLDGTVLSKFGRGSLGTLNQTVPVLLGQMEQLRELYRKRPLNVCIYSRSDLKTEIKEAVRNTLSKMVAKEHKAESRHQTIKDNSKRLFVFKSDRDTLQLSLLYPWSRNMNKKELKTFDFCSEMIAREMNGLLEHRLLHGNMGVQCQATISPIALRIAVDITTHGLTKITHVLSAVRNYLKFLYDKWETLDEFKYRQKQRTVDENPTLTCVAVMVQNVNFDDLIDELDVDTSKSTFGADEERKLISEQILHNRNVIYTIEAREPRKVYQVLLENYPNAFLRDPRKKVEPIFGTKFYIHETELFEHTVDTAFELEDLRSYNEGAGTIISQFIDAAVFEPGDTVFHLLRVKYLLWNSAHVREICTLLTGYEISIEVVPWGVRFHTKVAKANAYFDSALENFVIPDAEFTQCKERLMRQLTTIMTDSQSFASGLLSVAIGNFHLTHKKTMEPTPMIYYRLKNMDSSIYRNHFERIKGLVNSNLIEDRIEPLDKTFSIRSINGSELTTVTLAFYKISPAADGYKDVYRHILNVLRPLKRKLKIYTAACGIQQYFGIEGLTFDIRSVERKGVQTHQRILEEFKTTMKLRLPEAIKGERDSKAMQLYCDMNKFKIIVQVKGNTTARRNKSKFDDDFDPWFLKNECKLQELIDISK